MKKTLIYLLPALFLAGCAREDTLLEAETAEAETATLTADEAKFLAHQGMSVKFDQAEVDRIIDDAIGFLETVSPATRSAGRTVSRITPLSGCVGTAATRSDGSTSEDVAEEELFYAVDFDNNKGFALIAADRRLPDKILINVDHGSFPEDEIENPGFALMMAGAENYARREIAKYERWADSVETAMNERTVEADEGSGPMTRIKLEPTYEERRYYAPMQTTYGPWTTVPSSRIPPMIPVEWGQGWYYTDTLSTGQIIHRDSPFNRSVEAIFPESYIAGIRLDPDEGLRYIPAGCTAIAIAQLMAYWKHPTGNYHGHNITVDDWNDLCEWTGSWRYVDHYKHWRGYMGDAPDNIQKLCSDLILWVGQDVDMDYGQGGSSAPSRKAINLLQDHGYSAPSRRNYDKYLVLESISNRRPVYIHGYTDQTLGIFPDGDGHAWLIDGYLRQTRTVTHTTSWFAEVIDHNGNVIDSYYGYSTTTGSENSDYFHNNFGWEGSDNGYYIAGLFDTNNNPDLPSNTRSEEGNFQYNLRVWTNIHH